MEKYKYCNMGRARELSSGRREGGREGGKQEGRMGFSIAQKDRRGAMHVKGMSFAGYRDAAFG